MEVKELRKKLHPEEERERQFKEKVHKHSTAIKIIIGTIVVILLFASCAIIQAPKKTEGSPKACFKHDVCIDLILMKTPEELEIGLSNYSALPENTGMLFIFRQPGIKRMWMKDMDFPIDMFWLSSKGRVLHIEKKALPCTPPKCEIFEPNVDTKYVLETREGFALDTNLFDGDKVKFENLPG